MGYEKMVVIIMITFCAIVMAKVTKAEPVAQCKMEQPYRCVPIKGNQILCGCGL